MDEEDARPGAASRQSGPLNAWTGVPTGALCPGAQHAEGSAVPAPPLGGVCVFASPRGGHPLAHPVRQSQKHPKEKQYEEVGGVGSSIVRNDVGLCCRKELD